MGLTPKEKQRNYRERIRANPEKYNEVKKKDGIRKQKARLTWSKKKKELERRKERERKRKYRLSLSFSKEIDEVKNDFAQKKTPESFLRSLKKDKGVNDVVSKSIRFTPVSSDADSKAIKSTPVSSKAITSTPVSSYRVSKAIRFTPVGSGAVSKAIKFTPVCSGAVSKAIKSTPLSSKAIKSTPLSKKAFKSTPVSSKAIKSTPMSSKSIKFTPVSCKAIAFTPVRTPLFSENVTKKRALEKNKKQSPLVVSENVIKKMALEEKIKQFFVKHTWLCMRDKRLKVKPQVLMIPLKYLHKAFCDENPEFHVSMQKFSSLRPPKLQLVKKVDFSAFLSIYGGNSRVIIKDILKVCIGLPKQLRNLMCLNICDQNKEKCLSGACKKCSFYGKISSTNEMEEKIKLCDHSTMSGTHSKMNIIEKFVIGAFTPPPDLKPLQFHEVSRVLQTRLQESNKNINIVKIIQGANKSPRLQIQVEKTSKKQTEYKEIQAEEKGVSKNENEKKNKITQNKVLKTPNNDNETKVSKITKKNVQINDSPKNISQKKASPRDGKNKRKVSRKSIENELDKSISKPMKKESKNDKKETEKIKLAENNQSTKNKNKTTRTNKTDKERVQSQTNAEQKGTENEFNNPEKGAKRRGKQTIIMPVNHINEGNKIEKDQIIKSTTKENEENDKNLKRSLSVRTKTNEKIETNVNCKQSELVDDDSSKLQTDRTSRSKGEGNNICDKITNLNKVKGNSLNKKPQYRTNVESMQTSKDSDSSSEVSSTLDQTLHEYDESFSLKNKVRNKSKPRPKIILNPLDKKIKERRQSKITTFMAAEKSLDNKGVKNISNEDKSSAHTRIPSVEPYTSENVLAKSKQNEQYLIDDVEKSSSRKESKRISVREKDINKKQLKNLKKVRRSIVNELNESAISDLDTDAVAEGDKETMVSDRKRKSSKANPKSNNEEISEEPLNKKRKTDTEAKTLQSNNKKTKVGKAKTVAKTKESNSKKKLENKETNKPPENAESASEKELSKSKQNENYFIDNMVETSSRKMESKRLSVSEKDIDKEKLNKMKVRRSIVNELNESAVSDLDTDVVGEGDKENMVSDRKRKSSKVNSKSNNEGISKEPINKKKKTDAKTFHSDNKNTKAAKTKTIVKTKESNSKKILNKETTKPSKNNGSVAEKVLAKSKQNEKYLLDDVIEKSKRQTETKKMSVSEKDTDTDKIKKMKKVRRSIVTELNESALSDMDTDVVGEGDKENKISDKKRKSSKAKSKSKNEDISEEPSNKKKKVETKTLQSVNKKTKQASKTKPLAKTKQSNSKKKSENKETTKPPENNRAAAEAKARELLMPEDCPITAKCGTMKYLEQRTNLLKAIDNQRESEGDIFSSNIFKKKAGLANLLESENVDDTFAIRTPSSKGTKNDDGGVSPFTPRTGMFADWASLSNTSTSKTPTVNTLPTPKVDTEHKKVVMQVTYHMQKNKRRGIRKLQTNDEDDEKIVNQPSKHRKKNKSLIDLPNMPEEDGDLDDLGDDYFF